MTETSGFMDPGTYDAAQFARALRHIRKDGINVGYLNSLAVTANTPAAMNVLVATGGAYVQGCWYESDAVNTLTIDTAHATLDRIDRIILRKTSTTSITAVVLKGTAAASPAAPALTQTVDGTYEISLAQVLVTHAVTSIVGTTTTLITDERTDGYCAMGDVTITSAGTLDVGTHLISSVTDPVGDQDADTKAARNAAISTAVAAINAANLYGSGADGAINITSDTGSYSGFKSPTTFTVAAGKTLTCTNNLIIVATTSITINGTILATGASPVAAGKGSTGIGNATPIAGGDSTGVSLFQASVSGGAYSTAAGGAGALFNAAAPCYGAYVSTARTSYDMLVQVIAPIGGGMGAGSGGGGASAWNGTGGTGGKGGGTIILMAPTITIAAAGAITTNGAAGSNYTGDYAAGGGGGNGGDVLLVGKTITNDGTITQTGGAGGTGNGIASAAPAGNTGKTITIII